MNWKIKIRIVVVSVLLLALLSTIFGCDLNLEGHDADWETCSQEIDDHPCNFSLIDQNGDEFQLYDHYGKIIILEFSAMWCRPCQSAAKEVEQVQDEYSDDIVYVTVLIENEFRDPPVHRDINKWAKVFKIKDAPVLIGSRRMLNTNPASGWPLTAWPHFFIINKEMILKKSFTGFQEGKIELVILDMLKDDLETSD